MNPLLSQTKERVNFASASISTRLLDVAQLAQIGQRVIDHGLVGQSRKIKRFVALAALDDRGNLTVQPSDAAPSKDNATRGGGQSPPANKSLCRCGGDMLWVLILPTH
jgi:hypothetical protein